LRAAGYTTTGFLDELTLRRDVNGFESRVAGTESD
jgi:hypothetical protein